MIERLLKPIHSGKVCLKLTFDQTSNLEVELKRLEPPDKHLQRAGVMSAMPLIMHNCILLKTRSVIKFTYYTVCVHKDMNYSFKTLVKFF